MRLPQRSLTTVAAVVLFGTGLAALILGLIQGSEHDESKDLRSVLESPIPFAVDPEIVLPTELPVSSEAEGRANTLSSSAVGLEIPLLSLGLNSRGNFQIPDSGSASVYSGGSPLESTVGSSFIAGHVTDVSGVLAPMAKIAQLNAGDTLITSGQSGAREDWVVVSSQIVKRDGLDRSMWEVNGPRQLVLVTCGGELSLQGGIGRFTENLVVTAVPLKL